jgi:hypothetical protein
MSIAWIKVNGEWRVVNTSAKRNGEWIPTNTKVRIPDGWEGIAWSNSTPGGFELSERYLHKFSNDLNEFSAFYSFLAPETDPELEYRGRIGTRLHAPGAPVPPEDLITSGWVNPRPIDPNPANPVAYAIEREKEHQRPPLLFNSLHLTLIPKGPHRGKVLAMPGDVVVASSVGFFGTSDPWSLQPVSIIDFSKDAGTPEKPRFLNFLIPVGKSSEIQNNQANPPYTDITYPNFFCVGHAWSPSGDLIMAGGSRWGFNPPDLITYGNSRLYSSEITYAWNPALPGSWTSATDAYIGYTSVQIPFTSGHYLSAGCWKRGPNLSEYRWYSTVLPYPRVERSGGKPHMLVMGGESLQRVGNGFNRIPDTFNNYESLIVSGFTTSSHSGLFKDYYNGSYVFSGPSVKSSKQIYSALLVDSGSSLDIDLSVYNDSLYFFPRCFTTSSNAVCYAGFTHRSSLLINHGTHPGVWDKTVGNDISTSSARNKFRYYGSAFRVPNNVDQHRVDDIVRCGGGDTFDYNRSTQDTATTDILRLSDISGTSGANNYIQWEESNFMNEKRSTFNTVILPDASIFAIGGVENNLEASLSLRQSFIEDTSGFFTQVELSPLVAADHHKQMGVMPPAQSFEELTEYHGNHHVEEIYEIIPQESNSDPINRDGAFRFFVCPEILNSDRTEWSLYDWSRMTSWRDYHSASLLLPDGRVLISGGEGRHSAGNAWLLDPNNVPVPGYGVDYEIFSPKYIKPNQGPGATTVRPTGVGVSGATYNSHPQIDCPELNFNGQYIVSSNAFTDPSIYLERIVLMPPGNCTHHADTTQRYYKCVSQQINSTQLRITMPTGENILPRGFYMLFAVTNEEIPAEAVWVWVS